MLLADIPRGLAKRETATQDPPSAQPDASTGAPRSGSEWVVLVVDDALDTRIIYQRYLEFRGARVVTAEDGLEALQCIQLASPDAIILDLTMPRITGWDVLRELKANARTRSIPVVVISGHQAEAAARQAGADSYFEKPCPPDQVMRELLRLLREPTRRDR